MRLRTPGRIGMRSRACRREFGDDRVGQSGGLAAEDQDVAGRELRVVERARARGGQREPAARAAASSAARHAAPIAVHGDARVLVVVEPGALQLAIVHPEPQRLDQVQFGGRIGGEADHVAGVRRDFGMDEDDGEHRTER